jgi:hypothetical protein
MNRVKDYSQFAVCFVGLSYIAFWPLIAHDGGAATLEAALICGSHSAGVMDRICRPPYAMTLSPGLHLVGLLAAAGVVLRFLLCRLRRPRRNGSGTIAPLANRLPLRPLTPPSRPVKPRRQFGLRGTPH